MNFNLVKYGDNTFFNKFSLICEKRKLSNFNSSLLGTMYKKNKSQKKNS